MIEEEVSLLFETGQYHCTVGKTCIQRLISCWLVIGGPGPPAAAQEFVCRVDLSMSLPIRGLVMARQSLPVASDSKSEERAARVHMACGLGSPQWCGPVKEPAVLYCGHA